MWVDSSREIYLQKHFVPKSAEPYLYCYNVGYNDLHREITESLRER